MKVEDLQTTAHYQLEGPVNLYSSPKCNSLATQGAAQRYLRILDRPTHEHPEALTVCLCEDDYPGWLAVVDLPYLKVSQTPYAPIARSEAEIRDRLPLVIAFTEHAMTKPNEYLWGGTVGPNYDCSGLMQTAFRHAGIWIPRDAYQQEAFTQPVDLDDLMPGDLIFFGNPQKATHVGLYLGDDRYIHSSGKDQGRNGIGLDRVSGVGSTVSQTYHAQLRGAGRVVQAYQPTGQPWRH